MVRLVAVAAAVVLAAIVAYVAQRRRPDAPTQPESFEAPAQVDRHDFADPDAAWLVVVFTSSTCSTCAEVWSKAQILASDAVAAQEVEVTAEPSLHQRYNISGVPTTIVADGAGVVQRSWIGPVSSTHLWAALAELRDPGTVPPGCGDEPVGGTDPSAQADGEPSASSPGT